MMHMQHNPNKHRHLMKIFKPSPRYLTRLRVIFSLWAVSILAVGILTAGLISLNSQYVHQATVILKIIIFADLIWYLPAISFVRVSYDALTYILCEEEIIIQSGWWTKSIRRIPLSSVIAFETRWDRLDRWLEIGSLDVLTAADQNKGGVSVRLAGLADVEMAAQLANRYLHSLRDKQLSEWAITVGSQDHAALSLRHQI
jgi:membrane protein YdbS with pleckstrin-like domain